jgi:hypothetical protein
MAKSLREKLQGKKQPFAKILYLYGRQSSTIKTGGFNRSGVQC